MDADRLAVAEQRCDRLTKLPRDPAGRIRFALLNLCSLGMYLENRHCPLGDDGIRQVRCEAPNTTDTITATVDRPASRLTLPSCLHKDFKVARIMRFAS